MDHYEVLGVHRSASKNEIRRAYLKLARRYHPDFHQSEAVATEDSIAVKIRQVNAAWEILGDDGRRAEYDRLLIEAKGRSDATDPGSTQFRAASHGAPSVSRIRRPTSDFTPRDTGPDPSDEWRYQPDRVNPATVPSRLLLAAPVIFLVVGLGLLIISLPTGIRAFVAAGLICLFLAALLFIGAPMVAMFKSRDEELRTQRRR